MNIVYLLLGSNMDGRLSLLRQAREAVSLQLGRITLESSVYESEPWGFNADQQFLNQVIRIETLYAPRDLLARILRIESGLGRKRNSASGYSSRPIDIDILFYNDEIITEENLIIPHPGIPDRMFTLLPLSELDGAFIHPGNRKSINELIHECRDSLSVYPYPAHENET